MRTIATAALLLLTLELAQAEPPQAAPADDAITQISGEMIRLADSHRQVALALTNAHSKEGGTKNFVTSELLGESEQFGLCVTDLGMYLLDARYSCACPASSVNEWAKRARKHLEVIDKKLDVLYKYGTIVPSDVMTEGRSLQRDVEKAIEFCRRVELEFKDE